MRRLDLTAVKGSVVWLTVLHRELCFNLNKQEFRDAESYQNIYSTCVCGEVFTLDYALICKREGFFIERHDDPRDLIAELLKAVNGDGEVDLFLQDISEEQLIRRSEKAQGAKLDLHKRAICKHQRLAISEVRVCHPNAKSNKNIEPQQI